MTFLGCGNKRDCTGIALVASLIIGIIAAFLAALGWGIEGAVGGYACCMVDTEVAICIRQTR